MPREASDNPLDRVFDRLQALDSRRASLVVLSVAMAVSFVSLLYFGRDQYFQSDEWLYVVTFPGWSPEHLLHPDNGHLFLLHVAILNASISLFGAEHLPLQVVTSALAVTNAGLVYALVRRRVGPVMALAPAILLLFFGASFQIVLMPFSINWLLSFTFGLAAMLALDRDDRRGDLTAGGLLILSVLAYEWGLFFSIAMAIELWLRKERPPLGRFVLPAIPFAIWIAWKLWAPPEPGDDIAAGNVAHIFRSVSDLAASALAAIFGLFRSARTFTIPIDPTWGRPLVVAGAIAIVWRVWKGPRPSPRFWAMLGALLAFWLAVSLTVNLFRGPETNRFAYPGTVVLFLVAAELLRGVRIPRHAYVVVAVVLGASLMANVNQLREGGATTRDTAERTKSVLGVMQLTRGVVDPGFYVDEIQPGRERTTGLTFTAKQYFAEVDDHGEFGYDEAGILASTENARATADGRLGRIFDIHVEPVARAPESAAAAAPVEPEDASGAELLKSGPCLRMAPEQGATGTATVILPPGGFSFAAARYQAVTAGLRRFAAGTIGIELGTTLGSGVVRIPTDRGETPWRAQIQSERPVRLCPLGSRQAARRPK